MHRSLGIALGLTVSVLGPVFAEGAPELSLSGSHASMEHQNEIAHENSFQFVRNSGQVIELIAEGELVPARGNADYRLANVSHPVTRATTKMFIERLGRSYHESCGEPMVVTSLTRPLNEQPRNASNLSVHPAGMAVDLRIPARPSCRSWLEGTLLSLEKNGVLDVTREKHPAHYHVAVFPNEYATYVAPMLAADSAAAELARVAQEQADASAAAIRVATATLPPTRTTAGLDLGPTSLLTLVYATIVFCGVLALLLAMQSNRDATDAVTATESPRKKT